MKIAILYTTFLRDKLMEKSIQSILDNWIDDYILLIGDQNPTEDKYNKYNNLDKIYYFNLPYDCGLSYARNYLVEKAKELNIEYCFLTADSILFTEKYNFSPIIEFINSTDIGIIGFDLEGRPSWEKNLELVPGKYFNLITPKENEFIAIDEYGIEYKMIDMCRNIFLAKTKCLLENKWDNELKLCEHEDFFWRLKTETNWLVCWTDYISTRYEEYKPAEYRALRNRMYNEFRNKLKEKYKIEGWVSYDR